MSLSCSNRPICVDSRLDGYWNMVLDSLVINRSAKVELGSINFNFTCKNVELPLLQTPRVDVMFHGTCTSGPEELLIASLQISAYWLSGSDVILL